VEVGALTHTHTHTHTPSLFRSSTFPFLRHTVEVVWRSALSRTRTHTHTHRRFFAARPSRSCATLSWSCGGRLSHSHAHTHTHRFFHDPTPQYRPGMDDTGLPSASTPSMADTPPRASREDIRCALNTSLQGLDSELATYRNAQQDTETSGMSDEMVATHEGQCLMARLMHDEIGRLQSTGKPCTVCGCDGTCMRRYKFDRRRVYRGQGAGGGGGDSAGGAGGAGLSPTRSAP
jgi:hypothetical protein